MAEVTPTTPSVPGVLGWSSLFSHIYNRGEHYKRMGAQNIFSRSNGGFPWKMAIQRKKDLDGIIKHL